MMRDIGACFYYAKKQIQHNNHILSMTTFSKTMYNTLSGFGIHTISKTMGSTQVGLLSFFWIGAEGIQPLGVIGERSNVCVL